MSLIAMLRNTRPVTMVFERKLPSSSMGDPALDPEQEEVFGGEIRHPFTGATVAIDPLDAASVQTPTSHRAMLTESDLMLATWPSQHDDVTSGVTSDFVLVFFPER